jgi:hypothetical protein
MSTIHLGNGEKINISFLTERNENTIIESLSNDGINLLTDLKKELDKIDFNKIVEKIKNDRC